MRRREDTPLYKNISTRGVEDAVPYTRPGHAAGHTGPPYKTDAVNVAARRGQKWVAPERETPLRLFT